ncbi:DEAD/DEAH box helicase family protein [Sporosarcina luteola]|uniref:DEAD/DEAH box helicase family protein n=1 Tax=Sporosarcina luteola TaxID=582850 RepID=UPI00203F5BC3|nr:DEAD/DEAH box helicase family protein [Sporosarcina luteola]
MMIMVFRVKQKEKSLFESPQEMYRDYKRKKINGTLDYQSKMIDLYMSSAYQKKDVAFELPTGSGKTLIGLLIGEFRRRKNNEKIVYLCPTKQLVNQVVDKANNLYGIKAIGFTGSKKSYSQQSISSYMRAETIAVTNYSSLFNTNSFFDDADIIIFDDAHSSESYIANNWSLKISRSEHLGLFSSLVESLKDTLEVSQYNRLTNDSANEHDWIDKLPNLKFFNKIKDLSPLIESYVSSNNLRFPWQNIRDHLHACNMFLSKNEILIRPFIPPTLTHKPFANAKQRLYMSATLGESGELERITGVHNIHRLPIVDEWGVHSIGRRFFIFPNASFKEEQSLEILLEIKKLQQRALFLVHDDRTAKYVKEKIEEMTTTEVFLSKDLENSYDDFIKSDDGIAIMANRYDGIDFDGDKCHLLFLSSLPSSTHLQEQFITTRMSSSVLFNERIKTRIVQAIGRCTRSEVDYAAVVIFGTDLENALISPKKLDEFPAELKAELEFGYNQSESRNEISELTELLNFFYQRGEEWDTAEEAIISSRDQFIDEEKRKNENKMFFNLKNSAVFEVLFQYDLWKEDYQSALNQIEKVLMHLNGPELKGYKGYWNYVAGFVTYRLFEAGIESHYQISKEYYNKASKSTNTINWFNKLVDQKEITGKHSLEEGFSDIFERLEERFSKEGVRNPHKFEKEAADIVTLLNSDNGLKFEQGHERLGAFLGYSSGNSDSDTAPDPWWIVNDNFCIVTEDKIYEDNTKSIPSRHIKQAKGHEDWIRDNVETLNKNSNIVTLFISNSTTIENSSKPFTKNIFYIERSQFVSWAVKAIESIRQVRRSFNNKGDLLWRLEAEKILNDYQTTPKHFVELIYKTKLEDLPPQI